MSINERTLVIRIDIAKAVQYARAFDYRGIELGEVKSFENTAVVFKIFEGWIKSLANQKHKNNIVVGLGLTGHYWFNLGHFLKELGVN